MPTNSFRDPGGRVFSLSGRILRVVNTAGHECLTAALGSTAVQRFIERGRFVRTEVLPGERITELRDIEEIREWLESADFQTLVEHEAIAFPSYPYEWPPEMLAAAAQLTLELAQDLAEENLGLKDATPYNVLFRGPTPVFIDVLSIEHRDPRDPIWLPSAEFVRTFLLPLLASRAFGISLEQTLTRRDGLEIEAFYRWLTPLRRLLPPYLSIVSVPVWLGARHNPDDGRIYRKKVLPDAEKSRYIFDFTLARLRKQLERVAPKADQRSVWSNYQRPETSCSYTAAQFTEKEVFVKEALEQFSPRRVLDVGCNTGHFSAIAAKTGAAVVALDADPVVVGQTWRRAVADGLNIQPLVVNLARPTPATGWRNSERSSFLSRATGAFEAVIMLAVIHHMLVTERIPLPEIVDLAADFTTDVLIIEFVCPEDPMFHRLSRGRDELYSYLNTEIFEQECRRRFDIVRSRKVSASQRWLYLMRKKPL